MRIAIFLQDLSGGGAEKIMLEFANYIAESKFDEVYLILVRTEGAYKSLISGKIRIVSLNKSKTLYSLFALIRILKNLRIEVLYSTLVNANILALIAGKIVKIPVIIREANTIALYKKLEKMILIKFAFYMSKYIYKWSHKCIAISEAVKKDIVKFTNCPENKIHVIYNPIIVIDNTDAYVLHTYFNIILVSRLTVQKNIDTIIEVINRVLVEEKLKVAFHFFGEGDDSALKSMIEKYGLQEKILLYGFNISYYSYLKKMDLFIHIPIWEGLGNSVLEAYHSGIPMILSNVQSGFSELIIPAKNIHFTDPYDKSAIAGLIRRYVNREIEIDKIRQPILQLNKNEIFKRYKDLI